MTRTQYRRMCVFALRMVPTAIGGARWQNVLRDHVREILMRLNDECYWCYWPHIIDWDHSEYAPEEKRTQWGSMYATGLLCDHMKEYCWENDLGKESVSEGWEYSKVAEALMCCIRAGCDVAVSPSAGVLGWTVGDLKKMWRGKPLPKWVTSFYESDITAVSDETPIWL